CARLCWPTRWRRGLGRPAWPRCGPRTTVTSAGFGPAPAPRGRSASMRPNVVLIGFMGTGKTAIGEATAARLGYAFVDTDALIETRAGRSISQIFADGGEQAFRRLETQVVAAVAAQEGSVIATGGGGPLGEENMRHLRRNGLIVALHASPEAILSRLGDGADRPLLGADPEGSVRRLLKEREAVYGAADLAIETSSLPVEAAADRIVAF